MGGLAAAWFLSMPIVVLHRVSNRKEATDLQLKLDVDKPDSLKGLAEPSVFRAVRAKTLR